MLAAVRRLVLADASRTPLRIRPQTPREACHEVRRTLSLGGEDSSWSPGGKPLLASQVLLLRALFMDRQKWHMFTTFPTAADAAPPSAPAENTTGGAHSMPPHLEAHHAELFVAFTDGAAVVAHVDEPALEQRTNSAPCRRPRRALVTLHNGSSLDVGPEQFHRRYAGEAWGACAQPPISARMRVWLANTKETAASRAAAQKQGRLGGAAKSRRVELKRKPLRVAGLPKCVQVSR